MYFSPIVRFLVDLLKQHHSQKESDVSDIWVPYKWLCLIRPVTMFVWFLILVIKTNSADFTRLYDTVNCIELISWCSPSFSRNNFSLWNLKLCYYVQNNLILDLVLSQFYPVYTSYPIFVLCVLILSSHTFVSKWVSSFRFFDWIFLCHLLLSRSYCRAVPLIILDLLNMTVISKEYKLWSSLLCNFIQSLFTSSPLIKYSP
jgi:hypothetical protein